MHPFTVVAEPIKFKTIQSSKTGTKFRFYFEYAEECFGEVELCFHTLAGILFKGVSTPLCAFVRGKEGFVTGFPRGIRVINNRRAIAPDKKTELSSVFFVLFLSAGKNRTY